MKKQSKLKWPVFIKQNKKAIIQKLRPPIYIICQILIIVCLLILFTYLVSNDVGFDDYLRGEPQCNYAIEYRNKPNKTFLEPYECPRSGLQLIGHDFNIIYIKYPDVCKTNNLKCYYKDHEGTEWNTVHLAATLDYPLVDVKCMRNQQIIYKDLFPIVPMIPENDSITYTIQMENGIRKNMQLVSDYFPINSTQQHLNVLVFSLHGVSKRSFLRRMPKTHNFLKNRTSSILFSGLISKGWNSIDSFLSLFKNCTWKHKSNCNKFIWQLYQKQRYYTIHLKDSLLNTELEEDDGHLLQFDYKWSDMKSIEQYGNHWINDQPYCLKNKKYHEVLFKLLLEFCQSKRYLFALTSLNFGSSDEQELFLLDIVLNHFLEQMQSYGLLNNYMILIISDHGHLSGKYPDVVYHYQERFNPIAYFLFPEVHPSIYLLQVYQNLQSVRYEIVNHNFFYELLRSLVQLDSENNNLSYFNKYKTELRACPEDFPIELCPCFKSVVLVSDYVTYLVDYTVSQIKALIMASTDSWYCATLSRGFILSATYVDEAQTYVIKFWVYEHGNPGNAEMLEIYVQVKNRLPVNWKSHRLTLTYEEIQKPCLRFVSGPVKPFCLC